MSPGKGLPSDSIKVVPGRSKLRVESSNPVPRGTPNCRTSKVKLISSEEAIKLSSGNSPVCATSEVPKPVQAHLTPEAPSHVSVSPISEPPRPKPFRATSQVPKLFQVYRNPEAPSHVPVSPISEPPRPKPFPATSEVPKLFQVYRTPEAPSHVPVSPISEPPRPKPSSATSEVPKPVQASRTPEAPSHVPASSISEPPRPKPSRVTCEVPKPVEARPASKRPRPVLANTAPGLRKEIVLALRAVSLTTTTLRQKTNQSRLLQSKTVEPPSPRGLQIRSRVKQQTANATQVVEETIVEVGHRAKDHDFKEIRQSISDEELSELFQYLPALQPTWKGRIVGSAIPPEFDCEFWAKPASNIRRKAHQLSKAMPTVLKAEMLPTSHILNVFDRSPRLSNVEMYLFPDETKTERLKGEHAHLFDAMATGNTMIKVDINGTELLIFSSKLLDKTSQLIISVQKKTEENFLCGCFLQTKNSQAIVPVTSYQTNKDLDNGDVVDMELDTENATPSLILKLIAGSQSTPSSSPGKVNIEGSVPPGFEKIWEEPLVKLNIQGTSNPHSDQSGYAGLVRYETGKWVFGYSRCHKSISEVAAGLLAIYHGLKILWDSGFRKIHLETTSLEIINALTTNSDEFLKRKSILGVCKDMILKDWECNIYHISKEQNSCAEWLGSRVEGQPQGLVFYEYPPRGLVALLEKDHLAAAT